MKRIGGFENRDIYLHEDTLGITQKALKALRNELARAINQYIAVFQVPSSEDGCGCYGFIIVTANRIAIIGDGFRNDKQGEGGAGSLAADALLAIYGIHPVELLPEEGIKFGANFQCYEDVLKLVVELAKEERQPLLDEREPQYINYLIRMTE